MSSDDQRIKWRRNIAKNFNRLSAVHKRYRETDRRTDGRGYSEHEHEFAFAKKGLTTKSDIIHTILNKWTTSGIHVNDVSI